MNFKTIEWEDGSVSYYHTYYENNELKTRKLFTTKASE